MKLRKFSTFLKKVYFLARPYGRRKLAFVFLVMLAQGIFQVIGITSIFPFLALASNPSVFRNSSFGQRFIEFFPGLTDNQWLVLAGIFAICMLFAANALLMGGEVIRARYSHGFGHWLRMRLLNRIVSNPYNYFLRNNTGVLLKKSSWDVMNYVMGVLSPLLEGIARLITVLLILATLLLVDAALAIVAGVFFALFYAIIFTALKNRRQRTSDAMKEAQRGAMKEAQQLLGGIKPVKVHGKEFHFMHRYGGHSYMQAVLSKWFPIYQNFPRYLIEPLAFGGVVALVVAMAARGEDFSSLLPTLGVMALAGYRLIPNFQLLYGSATGMTLMMHSLEEVYEEFVNAEQGEEQNFTDCPTEPSSRISWNESIQLDEICFHYHGSDTMVINKVSLEIKKNQFVAFIGSTGSGKSTLVDILMALHWPQSGTIKIDGDPLSPASVRSWRAGIGYVPQEIFLLDDSIKENIAFGMDPEMIDLEQVKRVATVAQVSDFIENELPDGYETQVGERGVRLSGGQRQRIGLARALYHNPSLLVLDEATSALDNETEAALMQAIEDLYGQMTIVVIAHRLTTVRNANRIFELKNGIIVRSGIYEELGL